MVAVPHVLASFVSVKLIVLFYEDYLTTRLRKVIFYLSILVLVFVLHFFIDAIPHFDPQVANRPILKFIIKKGWPDILMGFGITFACLSGCFQWRALFILNKHGGYKAFLLSITVACMTMLPDIILQAYGPPYIGIVKLLHVVHHAFHAKLRVNGYSGMFYYLVFSLMCILILHVLYHRSQKTRI